jgi:hypothetical protein
VLAVARAKTSLLKFFKQDWALKQREARVGYRFDTINTAICAFENRVNENASGDVWHGKTDGLHVREI